MIDTLSVYIAAVVRKWSFRVRWAQVADPRAPARGARHGPDSTQVRSNSNDCTVSIPQGPESCIDAL